MFKVAAEGLRKKPAIIGAAYLAKLPASQRTVMITGPTGVRHSVEVMAETLFEAAAVGLAELRKGDWTDVVAPRRSWRFA